MEWLTLPKSPSQQRRDAVLSWVPLGIQIFLSVHIFRDRKRIVDVVDDPYYFKALAAEQERLDSFLNRFADYMLAVMLAVACGASLIVPYGYHGTEPFYQQEPHHYICSSGVIWVCVGNC
jgi:hypothetical protein